MAVSSWLSSWMAWCKSIQASMLCNLDRSFRGGRSSTATRGAEERSRSRKWPSRPAGECVTIRCPVCLRRSTSVKANLCSTRPHRRRPRTYKQKRLDRFRREEGRSCQPCGLTNPASELLLYEDEIRSVEGLDRGGGASGGPASHTTGDVPWIPPEITFRSTQGRGRWPIRTRLGACPKERR